MDGAGAAKMMFSLFGGEGERMVKGQKERRMVKMQDVYVFLFRAWVI